jgi:hypothetical protein
MIAVLVVLGEKPRVRTGLGLSAFAFPLLIVAFSLAFA